MDNCERAPRMSGGSSGGGGGGAPADAQYLVLALDPVLTQERLFTPGLGLAGVDGGANAPYTLNSTTWDRAGTVVQLVTPTDTVAIGAAVMFGAEVVRIVGDTRIEGKLTVTGILDPTAVLLSDPAAGTALYFDSADGQTAPVSGVNHARIRYNDPLQQWEQSINTGAYVPFAAGGGTNILTWNPDVAASAPSYAVFKTWAEIQVAAALIVAAGGTWDLAFVDADYDAAGGIPAGGPYLTGVRWVCDVNAQPYLPIKDGATFSEWPTLIGSFHPGPRGGLEVDWQGTATAFSGTINCTFSDCTIYASGTVAPFNLTGPSYVQLRGNSDATNEAYLVDAAGTPLFAVAAGQSLEFDTVGRVQIDNGTISGGDAVSTLFFRMRDEQCQVIWTNSFIAGFLGFAAGNVCVRQLDQRYQFPGWGAGRTRTTNMTLAPENNNWSIPVDTTAGNRTITLPASADIAQGPNDINQGTSTAYSFSVMVSKINTGTNTITIIPNGADNLQGVNASLDLTTICPAAERYSVTISAVRTSAGAFDGWYVTALSTNSTAGTNGWTRDGTPAVRLTTVTDPVGIGTAAPAAGLKVDVTGSVGRQGLRSTTTLAADITLASRVTGDAVDRFTVADAEIRLGSGAIATDVSMARGVVAGVVGLWVNSPVVVNAAQQGVLVVSGVAAATNPSIRLFNGIQSSGLGQGGVGTEGVARGNGAVDLQFLRTVTTQVATGARSAILGGARNRISAAGTEGMIPGGTDNVVTAPTGFAAGDSNSVSAVSGVAMGLSNTVSGAFGVALGQSNSVTITSGTAIGRSVTVSAGTDEGTWGIGSLLTVTKERAHVLGYQGVSDHIGTQTWAAGQFSVRGDTQEIKVNWHASIVGAVLTEIFLAGGIAGGLAADTPFAVPINSSYLVDVRVLGHRTDAAGVVIATTCFWFATDIRRLGAGAAMDGPTAPYRTVQSATAVGTAAVVDASGTTLRVRVQGLAGQTWRWTVIGNLIKTSGLTT